MAKVTITLEDTDIGTVRCIAINDEETEEMTDAQMMAMAVISFIQEISQPHSGRQLNG